MENDFQLEDGIFSFGILLGKFQNLIRSCYMCRWLTRVPSSSWISIRQIGVAIYLSRKKNTYNVQMVIYQVKLSGRWLNISGTWDFIYRFCPHESIYIEQQKESSNRYAAKSLPCLHMTQKKQVNSVKSCETPWASFSELSHYWTALVSLNHIAYTHSTFFLSCFECSRK